MKKLFSLILLITTLSTGYAQNNGPISAANMGYGKSQNVDVDTITYASPKFDGRVCYLFYPKNHTKPLPTIFFSHGFGGDSILFYRGILQHIAQSGYAVVFSPYTGITFNPTQQYTQLFNGFQRAVENYPTIIDSTRVGFMGHSFGAGASFTMAYRGLVEKKWGENAAFIFPLAQYYTFLLEDSNLKKFPPHTKLLTQIYQDDATTDHRNAIEIFKNINISNENKDFMVLYSDTIATSDTTNYIYNANHGTPTVQRVDALDFYGIYKPLDALCDFVFNNVDSAKKYCLGNGTPEQTYMGEFENQTLKPALITDNPTTSRPSNSFSQPCSGGAVANPRRDFCTDGITAIDTKTKSNIVLYPNPNSGTFIINTASSALSKVNIFDILGKKIYTYDTYLSGTEINAKLTTGIYFVNVEINGNNFAEKILIE